MTRTCVVTGGAGSLGLGIARRLASSGWIVVSLDIVESAADADCYAESIIGDVARPDSHREAAAAAASLGTLQGWVNCAGYNSLGSVIEVTEDQLTHAVGVNLLGVFHGTAAACRSMLAHEESTSRGAIVNISSIQATVGFPGFASYAMAKGGIEALTRQVAAEYVANGIRCNVVAPGLIGSAMNERLLADAPDPEALLKAWRPLTPMGRWGTANDVAAAVSFLLSEEASFITGETLAVNGGALTIAPGQVGE